jgi:hypothetical protein
MTVRMQKERWAIFDLPPSPMYLGVISGISGINCILKQLVSRDLTDARQGFVCTKSTMLHGLKQGYNKGFMSSEKCNILRHTSIVLY